MMCHNVLAHHPDWLPNFLCVTNMQQHYFFGNCWWPKPLPEVPGCDQWCQEMLACNLSAAFELPADDCICQAACDGYFALTGEAAEPLVACAAKKLDESCDIEAMTDCFEMPLNCDEVCQGLAAQCAEGQDLAPLFAEEADCIETCQESSQEQLFALDVCLMVDHCYAPDSCAGIPELPLAGCAEFCEVFLDLCPAADMPQEYCPWVCTGAALALQQDDATEAVACLEQYDVCPLDQNLAFVGCLAGPCLAMCQQTAQKCGDDSAYAKLFETVDSCQDVCSDYTPFQAEAAGICMLVGGCDNPTPCLLPPEAAWSGCGAYCEALLELCPAIPWLEPGMCPAFCTGVGMQNPAIDPATAPACLEQFEQCPANAEQAIFGCLAGKCGSMCGLFEQCEPGSEYRQHFESKETCTGECGSLTYGQAYAAGICLGWAGCDNALDCIAPPLAPPAGCDSYCEALLALCPEYWPVGPTNCPGVCTGLTMAIPIAQPEDADVCFQDYPACPEAPEEAIYGCMVDLDPQCTQVCDKLETCGLTLGWACDVFCTVLEATEPASYGWFTQCVTQAASCTLMKPCVGQ
jgi:hypothetical protein